MADERYLKYLQIEPAGETATYYELLDVDPTEADAEVLEKAYKTQIRKLQAIRTSKDIGWIDYHKETLRDARRSLKDAKRRKAYDESLAADSEQEFKDFVMPLLALGQLSVAMIDAVLIPKAKSDGLTEDRARAIIADLASEHNVTIASEDAAAPEDDYDDDYDDGYDDGDYPDAGYDSPEGGEVVLQASPGWAPKASAAPPPEAQVREPEPARDQGPIVNPPWVMPEAASDPMPWGRGGSFSWGKAIKSKAESTADLLDESWLDEESRKILDASIGVFNHGARLAKVGADVHRNLRTYFPPANGKTVATPKINGVSFEKLFETERKTYLDTLKAFREACAKVGDVKTGRADELRDRGAKNIALVNSYIAEMKQHKMGLMGGGSTQETLRAWQSFVNSRRSPRLHRTIQELAKA